jgi:flagellar export protein FliJ
VTDRALLRAARLTRVAKVGDALAKSAERIALDRRRAVEAEQQRLETVQKYCGDYGQLARERELAGQTVNSLRVYREFSGWLSTLSQDQLNRVAQAEFLLAAAVDEARGRRRFADAIDKAAAKSGKQAAVAAERREQANLDELAGRRVAFGLHR